MSETPASVEKRVQLSSQHADRLNRLAQARHVSEDQIVEKALDILFSLTELFGEHEEWRGWSILSEESLRRVWDNEEDAVYDHWRELYGVPAR